MWQIEYSDEVKFYFLDNYPYTFDLLVRIEELKFSENGIPPEGCRVLEPQRYWWEVLGHIVIYRLVPESGVLRVLIVKPIE